MTVPMRTITKVIEWISNAAYRVICGILRREYTESGRESFFQFVKFGIVGCSNTVISYAIYTFSLLGLRRAASFRFDYMVAQILAFVISVFWSYIWNSRAVFSVKDGESRPFWRSLAKTYVSYSFTGLFLSGILLWLWVNVFSISEFLAPITNLIITVPLNFFINKYWTFKK